MPYPGTWALIPTISTLLMILSGPKSWINKKILSNRWLIWLGLISYPLYLWHWPILTYVKIIYGKNIDVEILIIILVLSILLSWLTYRYIELPFRRNSKNKLKVIILILLMSIIGYIGYNTYIRDGLSFRLNKYLINPGWVACEDTICEFGNRQSDKLIILYGDSHANHIAKQLIDRLGRDYAIDIIFDGECFMGTNIRKVKSYREEICQREISALEKMSNLRPYAVITGQRWYKYGIETRDDVLEAVKDRITAFNMNPEKLVILGTTTEINFSCELNKLRPIQLFVKDSCQPDFHSLEFNKKFKEVTEKLNGEAHFIYPDDYLCINDQCKFSNGGISNYADTHHLTYAGSEPLVSKIISIIDNK